MSAPIFVFSGGHMGETFSASPATIGGLLTSIARERIVVPTFQRGYMWQKKHVEAFWRDVTKQQSASKLKKGLSGHFLGPIVTMDQPEDGVTWILDGQQRLATATILFAIIRDVAREIFKQTGIQQAADFAAKVQIQFIEREDTGYSLELGATDAVYFRETIQHDPPTTRPAKIRTHRNIKAARRLLLEKVTVLTGKVNSDVDALRAIADLKELKQTVVSDLIMTRIPVTSQRAAFRIFETLNDRGLRLSESDLLLSYLMGEAPDDEQKDVRDLWTEMIQRMGTHDINHFLRHMWVSSYGDIKEDLFDTLKEKIEKDKLSSIDFARSCADECESYVQIIRVEEDELGKEAAPFVKALVQELHVHAALPLLLSSYLVLERKDFVSVAKWLLVFVTRYSIVGNLESSGMEDLLFRLAREVREAMKEKDKADPKQAESMSKRAAYYVRDTLVKSAPDIDKFRAALEKLDFDDEPAPAKYVLTRLARYIQSPTKEITLGDTNLEHIYPQNPAETEWGGKPNQELLDPFLWHIGNLTIFGKRANRKAENKEYSIKQPKFAASQVVMTSNVANTFTAWDVDAIKKRAIWLAKFGAEIWDFENTSRV